MIKAIALSAVFAVASLVTFASPVAASKERTKSAKPSTSMTSPQGHGMSPCPQPAACH